MPRLLSCLLFIYGTSVLLLCQQNHKVQVQEHVTISESAQATVSPVSAEIKAGEMFEFTVTLDKQPSFVGGDVAYSVMAPNRESISTSCGVREAVPTRIYHCGLRIPVTAPGGIWSVEELYFREGTKAVKLSFHSVTFRVIPSQGLVFPTSAEISVNLNQVQLLRRDATRLQGRIQELKSAVSEYALANREGAVTPLLRENLMKSVSALQATQEEFLKLATSEGQRPNAEVFFGDLRKSYQDTISHLGSSATALTGKGHLLRVSDVKKGTEPLLALALRPMEQNVMAYKAVADAGSLTFDLDVDSTPEGAGVSYHRKGDPARANPDPTRSTIRSLPYAIWIIHFEKPGYKPEEREHDPFREPNHVVHVDLQK